MPRGYWVAQFVLATGGMTLAVAIPIGYIEPQGSKEMVRQAFATHKTVQTGLLRKRNLYPSYTQSMILAYRFTPLGWIWYPSGRDCFA